MKDESKRDEGDASIVVKRVHEAKETGEESSKLN